MAKITLTYEGETISYSDEATKVVTVSFENPKSVNTILHEITGFLKASGYPIGDNQQLVLGYDQSESPTNGIQYTFSDNLHTIRNMQKSFIGPEDC
jgi:hypothetical protein